MDSIAGKERLTMRNLILLSLLAFAGCAKVEAATPEACPGARWYCTGDGWDSTCHCVPTIVWPPTADAVVPNATNTVTSVRVSVDAGTADAPAGIHLRAVPGVIYFSDRASPGYLAVPHETVATGNLAIGPGLSIKRDLCETRARLLADEDIRLQYDGKTIQLRDLLRTVDRLKREVRELRGDDRPVWDHRSYERDSQGCPRGKILEQCEKLEPRDGKETFRCLCYWRVKPSSAKGALP